jgi:hypothetical protein
MFSAGIPIENISKMMEHTNIACTQVYAQVTDDKISEDMDKLILPNSEKTYSDYLETGYHKWGLHDALYC